MNAAQIMHAALENMASQGNEQAKLTLALVAKDIPNGHANIIDQLKSAHTSLASALGANGKEWTRRTDNYIIDAQQTIVSVIGML